MLISLFDTTICDDNLGNNIIMENINQFVDFMFPDSFIIKLPHIDNIGNESLNYINKSNLVFFGGTNALSSDLNKYSQVGFNTNNSEKFKNKIILFGVGWWQYQGDIEKNTNSIYHDVLSNEYIHSVRDSYTKFKLESIGYKNVINTGCPSLWNLTKSHCEIIPTNKSESVLTTLTYYCKDPKKDLKLLKTLKKNYKTVFFWPQGSNDYEYLLSLGVDVEILKPRIRDLDLLLSSDESIDYIGTRLHAGIRALQNKRKSYIISIDNRASEMHKDWNLPILDRENIDELGDLLNTSNATEIMIPINEIDKWKSQFHSKTNSAYKTEKFQSYSRTEPISRLFGLDIGTPIDRYYIEKFLNFNKSKIHGTILEVGDDIYTNKFGSKIISSDVLNDSRNKLKKIAGNLETGVNIPKNVYNCIICTQTIQVIFNLRNCFHNLINALVPGGTLLITASGISQISRYDYDRWGEYWRFTEQSLYKISNECSLVDKVTTVSYGNLATSKAFLDGIPTEKIHVDTLNYKDSDYQLCVCAKITRKTK